MAGIPLRHQPDRDVARRLTSPSGTTTTATTSSVNGDTYDTTQIESDADEASGVSGAPLWGVVGRRPLRHRRAPWGRAGRNDFRHRNPILRVRRRRLRGRGRLGTEHVGLTLSNGDGGRVASTVAAQAAGPVAYFFSAVIGVAVKSPVTLNSSTVTAPAT